MAAEPIPPIFVISLENATDRQEQLSEMMASLGLDFEFVPAVDGRNLTSEEIQNVYSKKQALKWKGRELSVAEIGCSLSHISVWEKLLDEGITSALILEDDVHLGRMFQEFLNHIGSLPDDWDIVILYSSVRAENNLRPLFDIHSVGEFTRWPDGAVAYLLRSTGAKKLMQNCRPVFLPADHYTGRQDVVDMKRYGVMPQITAIRDVASTIGDRTNGLGLSWQRKLRASLLAPARISWRLVKRMIGDRSID